MEKSKKVDDSRIEMRELVLPNDTNLSGNLLGGRLMHFIDIAGAMAASKHSLGIVATAAIDSVDFKHPVKLGEIVTLKSRLTRAGTTSMEVLVEVFSENVETGETAFTNKAYITYVAIDRAGKPRPVPAIVPVTEDEKIEYEAAGRRREERLKRREQK
jgi:acyl-CoA hydrolase